MIPATLKPRKCSLKSCRQEFTPDLPGQLVCSWQCGRALIEEKGREAQARRVKREEKEFRQKKRDWRAKNMTRSERLARVQHWCNLTVRLEQAGRGCISCGNKNPIQFHAGHFRGCKACPSLRFHPLNIWLQCSQCNDYLSGNTGEYRISLLKEVGQEAVDWLEGPHPAVKYTDDELEMLEEYFKFTARNLKRDMELLEAA